MVDKLYTPTNLQLINKVNELVDNIAGGGVEILDFYGTCSTAAGTQTKVVTCEDFTLKTGVSIRVKFTNAQTYNGAPKLNVNGTGAIKVQARSGSDAVRYTWLSGEVVAFTYDGSTWIMEDSGIATTTYYGITKLATSATSTATAFALTPLSLNSLVQNMIEPYPIYSTSATYEVGEKVRYGYQAWECTTAISTAEAWTEEHWTPLDPIQTQIDNKISNTDYATSGTAGTIKISSTTGTGISSAGVLYATNSSYTTYSTASDYFFISKGTLENVFASKGFCGKITEQNPALTPTNGICTWNITNSLGTADVTVNVKDVATNKHIVHEAISTSSTITIKIVSSSNISEESLKAIITG